MMLNRKAHASIGDIRLKRSLILFVSCIFILSALPEVIWAQHLAENNETNTNPVIKFYQNHISGIDGNRCPMYPQCSQYSAQAIRKHGVVLGWIMACDRLLRCGKDEVRLSPHIKINERELTFDPVNANDFWWFSPNPSAIDTDVATKRPYQSGVGQMPAESLNHQK
jgi:putative membrane protein insertion efficiency factor